jgi:hypothetical protein
MTEKKKPIRCVIYTRKSSEEGQEQEFNSLDTQREAGEAYIHSQKHHSWSLLPNRYDDGGISGGTMERQGLQQLLADVRADKVDVVVVYKMDRLSHSLGDFAQIIDLFDKHDVSFVSVTQQFNTTSSMGRLTLKTSCSPYSFEPSDDDLGAVLGIFHSRLSPILEHQQIELRWQVRDVPPIPHLGSQKVLHLLRILQEASTNVLKHTEASKLTFATELSFEDTQPGTILRLTIPVLAEES